jgi:YidC/Oxa1 family membrane protein insertase
VFFFLYHVLRGLTYIPEGADTFSPKYLDESSTMYQDLHVTDRMMAFGIDLAESASKALGVGFIHALPHIMLVLIVALSSYYQQRQIQGRNPNADIPQQQQMIMKLLPLMMVFVSFVAPAALVVYFVVSNLYRIGMQYYITRTLYHGEDSLGAQAQRASAEAKKLSAEAGGTDLLPKIGKKAKAAEGAANETTTKKAPPATPKAGTNGTSATPPTPTSRTNPNRSKKKKKRR